MWVSKPIYESLPYFYLLAGAISLGLSMYLNYWYLPTICFVVGLVCLVGGLVVLLKRRDSRVADRRVGLIISGGNVDLDNLPWTRSKRSNVLTFSV